MSELTLERATSTAPFRAASSWAAPPRSAPRRAAISSMLTSADAVAARDAQEAAATLRLGLGGGSTTDSIDITTYNDSVMIDVSHGLFNGLVEWGEDGKPKPELAESFEPSNGAKDWIFNLRKGIKFSNGQEFTADDAIYSLNLHRGETKSGGAASVKADHRHQEARQIPDPDFAGRAPTPTCPIALTDYHILMVPDGFKDWAKPVGTGAVRAREVRSRRAHLAEEDAPTTGRRGAAISTASTSPSSTTARRASTP